MVKLMKFKSTIAFLLLAMCIVGCGATVPYHGGLDISPPPVANRSNDFLPLTLCVVKPIFSPNTFGVGYANSSPFLIYKLEDKSLTENYQKASVLSG